MKRVDVAATSTATYKSNNFHRISVDECFRLEISALDNDPVLFYRNSFVRKLQMREQMLN